MPIQSVVANGNTYTLYPLEMFTQNPDYVVQLALAKGNPPSNGAPPVTVGLLRWAGNGITTFDYVVYQIDNSSLGMYKDIPTAIAELDSVLYPS